MNKGLINTLGLNKRTFSGRFGLILAVFAFVVLTVTPMFYMVKYMMGLWVVLLLFSSLYIRGIDKRIRQVGLLGMVFIFMCFLYKVIGLSSAKMAYCIGNPWVYFGPVVALSIIDKCNNENQIRFLLHFISLAIAINVIDGIRLANMLGINNVAYQQLSGMLEERAAGLNLGGSMFVNMVVFYANIMFFAYLKSSERLEKILFLLYTLIGAYFIIMCSMKGSAVIILLVTLVLQYVAHKGGSRFGRTVVISIIVVGLFFVFRDSIIYYLISIVGSDRIADRLIVFTSAGNVTDSSTFMAREDLWLVSVETWLRSPINFIFGIGDHAWNEYISTAYSGIGNHADLFDVLARYGLIGGLLLYSSIKIFYEFLQRRYKMFRLEIISFFILFLIMGLTKKFMAGEPAITIFILFPVCLKHFNQVIEKQY